MKISDSMPVLVGAGQWTCKMSPAEAPTPLAMIIEVARRAARDAGIDENTLLSQVDTIANTRLAVDSTPDLGAPPVKTYENLPADVAAGIGAKNVRAGYYCGAGGDTPQMLVNEMAERIAQGKSDVVLLAGSENLGTLMAALKSGVSVDWTGKASGKPLDIGTMKSGCSDHEKQYGFFLPINTYPMFENALRAKAGRSIDEHQKFIGKLFSPLSVVAAKNPESWFPVAHTPEEMITVNAKNRMVSFPYPKYLNSVINVDMAAAVLMMSVGTARKLGIDRSRWIFLNGCAQASDHWYVSERRDYTSSPAMKRCGEEALKMAGLSMADMRFFDIYSCFPSAVQIACREFGISLDDPRGLTLTGGLPYFGGPGNNYVMHSIAEMMKALRAAPGTHGFLNSNGWHVTKHAVGIYSTEPRHEQWQRVAPQTYQRELDAMPKPAFTETPQGAAEIETYTVTHGLDGPQQSIVIGRLTNGTRFLAHTPSDPAVLNGLMTVEGVGRKGHVTQENGKNLFRLD